MNMKVPCAPDGTVLRDMRVHFTDTLAANVFNLRQCLVLDFIELGYSLRTARDGRSGQQAQCVSLQFWLRLGRPTYRSALHIWSPLLAFRAVAEHAGATPNHWLDFSISECPGLRAMKKYRPNSVHEQCSLCVIDQIELAQFLHPVQCHTWPPKTTGGSTEAKTNW